MDPFKVGKVLMQKHKRIVTILYSHESIMQRKDRVRDGETNVVDPALVVCHMISNCRSDCFGNGVDCGSCGDAGCF